MLPYKSRIIFYYRIIVFHMRHKFKLLMNELTHCLPLRKKKKKTFSNIR